MNYLLLRGSQRVGKFTSRRRAVAYARQHRGYKYTLHKLNTDWRSRAMRPYVKTWVIDTLLTCPED